MSVITTVQVFIYKSDTADAHVNGLRFTTDLSRHWGSTWQIQSSSLGPGGRGLSDPPTGKHSPRVTSHNTLPEHSNSKYTNIVMCISFVIYHFVLIFTYLKPEQSPSINYCVCICYTWVRGRSLQLSDSPTPDGAGVISTSVSGPNTDYGIDREATELLNYPGLSVCLPVMLRDFSKRR